MKELSIAALIKAGEGPKKKKQKVVPGVSSIEKQIEELEAQLRYKGEESSEDLSSESDSGEEEKTRGALM